MNIVKLFLDIKNKFSFERKIKSEILFSFLIIQIFAIIFIIVYTKIININSLLKDSVSTMVSASEEKTTDLDYIFRSVESAIVLESLMVNNYDDINISNSLLIKYMNDFLMSYPQVDNLKFGMIDGRFLSLLQLYDKKKTFQTAPDVPYPKNSVAAIRVGKDSEDKSEKWYYIDKKREILDQEELPKEKVKIAFKKFDWYKNTLKLDDLTWSELYVFGHNGQLGIAASYPIKDENEKTIGVLSAAIALKVMMDVLKKKTYSGVSVIINKKGQLISHPEIQNTAKSSGTTITDLLSLDKLDDKTLNAAFVQYKRDPAKSEFTFYHNNKQYLACFRPLDMNVTNDWTLVSIAPICYFSKNMYKEYQRIYIELFFIILISIVLLLLLSRKISNPIMLFIKQMDLIREFNLDEQKLFKSKLIEIENLQNSINQMRLSLKTFSKFVPKNLARIFMEQGKNIEIGGELKNISILFTDIENFTTIAENCYPEELVSYLSEYFDEVTQIIIDSKGTIDKYIGDSIMAFWGAPIHDEDHVLHCCEATILCQKKIEVLNKKWAFEKKPIFNTRFGVNTGEVIVGNIGSVEHMNYTIIGAEVNVASQLESFNKIYGTKLIISQTVYEKIKMNVIARPLDVVLAKGMQNAIIIYEMKALLNVDPFVLPSADEIELCSKSQEAFEFYLNQNWDEAIKIYDQIRVNFPNDVSTDILHGRCVKYKKCPPDLDWEPITYLID